MAAYSKSSYHLRLSLSKQMFIGACIALTLIIIYLFTVKEPDPDWGRYWMLRPISLMVLAGAMGGFFNYVIINFRSLAGLSKTAAITLSLVVFIFGLYMGFVLGLADTL